MPLTEDARAEVVRLICRNAHRWDLWEFARRVGGDANDQNVQKRFRLFQDAAYGLARFDHLTVLAITSPS